MADENMIQNQYQDDVIDLRVVFRKLWAKKFFFVKVWGATFVLSCIFILPVPRIYQASLTLAPEMGGSASGGTLSSIASSFGIDLGNQPTADAFYPELYPDVMSTNEFLVDLLNAPVQSMDGEIDTTYLVYMTKMQKKNPLSFPYRWAKKQVLSLVGDAPKPISAAGHLNPRMLSKEEDALVNKLRDNIICDVDIKTSVITITVKDQDPLICVTIADSARLSLQRFITEYRTSKARVDMDYYKSLADSARAEYDASVRAYSNYCDMHQNVILQSFASERDNLENDMQAKLSTYNAIQTQYQMAKAKVQERTPAFTVLQSASVPVKASSPKRMIFVLAMLFLSTIVSVFILLRKELGGQLFATQED